MNKPPQPITQPAGIDASYGNNAGDSVIKFAFTGTAPGVANDQGYFFANQADVVKGATYALGTMTPSVSRFTNLQVGAFIALNMAYVRGANITGADSAGTISSLLFEPSRYTPFGESQEEQVHANTYQTARDQQLTRVTVPFGITVDGYTFIRSINDSNATPASFAISFVCTQPADRRNQVPETGPVVVKSSAT